MLQELRGGTSGADYAAAVHTNLIVRKRGGDETELNPEVVRLRGRRLLMASETDSRRFQGQRFRPSQADDDSVGE
jgi:hypothetical protein